ncbi:MAG: DNA primase [Clostridiales bacterium]|nr:DNA primase [Clostridiales bacterium]
MPRYSDDVIDEVRRNSDIVEVISQYVNLKKSGRTFFGLCPFHGEKSPSFAVSPDKQIFHCFGCNVGGNVFHFLSKIENISFRESLEMLANRANITLPTSENDESNKISYLKSRVYEINKQTAQYYHENLYKPTAKIAQEYIKKRKLDNNTLKNFLIGYSGNFNELYKYLKSQGFSEEEILASSLVNKNEKGEFVDRYRKRLMFPIQDERGRVIAFGGRILEENKIQNVKSPKYINTSENIVYTKGRHLFGLYLAKKNKIDKLLVVEGYMDAISLHQRGITNVVASLGTALTEAQGRLLKNNSQQIIIGYDSDSAGQAATLRGLEILQNLGCDLRILQLDGDAKDPDEYIVKYGPERLQRCMNNAISLIEYKIKNLKESLNLDHPNDKIKFLTEIAKELSKINSDIEKEVYIDKIALDYKISKEAIHAEINKLLYGKNNNDNVLQKKNIVKKEVKPHVNIVNDSLYKKESMIVYLLINYPNESYSRLKDKIHYDNIQNEVCKKVIKKLYEELEKENEYSNVLDLFDEEDVINYLTWVLAYDFDIQDVDKCIEDILNNYEKDKLISMRNEIVNILESTEELTKDEVASLEQSLSEIIIKLAKIK